MQQIFVYGDSLSWGIVPDTRRRLPFDARWPGVLENALLAQGRRVRVLEDCLNGRRTVWEDPFKAGRRGLDGLAQRMEIHSPLSLVIVMLGTNDFQFSHPFTTAWSAAQGVGVLVQEIRKAQIEPGMPVPPVLIVCPPPMCCPKGAIAPKFEGADQKCIGLPDAYRALAESIGAHFFDAGSVIACSDVDGVHLDEPQHTVLGQAIARVAAEILA